MINEYRDNISDELQDSISQDEKILRRATGVAVVSPASHIVAEKADLYLELWYYLDGDWKEHTSPLHVCRFNMRFVESMLKSHAPSDHCSYLKVLMTIHVLILMKRQPQYRLIQSIISLNGQWIAMTATRSATFRG